MDIGDGDKFSLISKIIPDITFNGHIDTSNPSAEFSIKTRNFPGINLHETSSGTATRTCIASRTIYKRTTCTSRGRCCNAC